MLGPARVLCARHGSLQRLMSTAPGAPPAAPAGNGPSIAVVGGGIAGMTCADILSSKGYRVTVFDMGKHRPGGRAATRTTYWHGLSFDQGAQFFSPRSEAFAELAAAWAARGLAAEWSGKFVAYDAATGRVTPRPATADEAAVRQQGPGFFNFLGSGPVYVGTPDMAAICSGLASSGAVQQDVRVSRACFDRYGKWLLEGHPVRMMKRIEDRKQQPLHTPWNLGVFDALVIADRQAGDAGAPGYMEFLGTEALKPACERIASVGALPQLALMLSYEDRQPLLPFDGASVSGSQTVQWIACNSSKPGRDGAGDAAAGSSASGGAQGAVKIPAAGASSGMQSWVVLSTIEFAQELVVRDSEGKLPPQTPEYLAALAPKLYSGFLKAVAPLPGGKALPPPSFMQLHRWGAALPAQPLGESCLTVPSVNFAACGDFCLGGGIENAALSGLAAADAICDLFE